ncbi:hypothetical protein RM844_09365 [Streptomyces sp. DSM 44915]|uniref:ABC transporter permease n=1 Tax=Streptomyces chisholmiae TaxID=3075540 RepID=A0ABU2JND7_9ACTN|nr:hypothetical protein [Streptomyces sp. DSM 44915]MDT0266505.1 hypothetical protein [Streptomyces sp. DSM 44915]
MSTVRQVNAFLRTDLITTVRFWYVSLFTVAMTSFYYVMLSRFIDPAQRPEMTLTFVILAVLGVTLFQFAIRASTERVELWSVYVRTLPVPLWITFLARLILVVLVGSLAATLLLSVGTIRFELDHSAREILRTVIAVPVAALVFAPIAACIGGVAHPRFAPALMTVIYLTTTWTAGVWSRGLRPEFLDTFDFLLPLQAIQGVAVELSDGAPLAALPRLAVAAGWSGAAFLLARWIHQRDEGETY